MDLDESDLDFEEGEGDSDCNCGLEDDEEEVIVELNVMGLDLLDDFNLEGELDVLVDVEVGFGVFFDDFEWIVVGDVVICWLVMFGLLDFNSLYWMLVIFSSLNGIICCLELIDCFDNGFFWY